jgi:hypothetical protein
MTNNPGDVILTNNSNVAQISSNCDPEHGTAAQNEICNIWLATFTRCEECAN